MSPVPPTKMEKLTSWAKRRGFIFPTAEIYGGLGGFWDWGPLGVELKNNLRVHWWKRFVQDRSDVVGLDSAIITNPKVFEASGHLKGFHDALVECKSCHQRFKADDVSTICLNCGGKTFTKPANFNLMFKTAVGSTEEASSAAYLRPETAQGIFVNFQNVQQSMRLKLPFGIAQIGKAFRNEITPGNFVFRSREFEQMEIEFFCAPGEDDTWFDFWRKQSLQWFLDFGIRKEHIRFRDQPKAELAHYAKATTDIEYEFPFSAKGGSASGGDKGWAELMGVSNRTDFDLKAHGQTYREEGMKEAMTPYCIEPSAGVDRAALAFLLDAYEEVEGGRTTTTEATKDQEVILRLHKALAPIKVAVLPLSKKGSLIEKAKGVADLIRPHFVTWYDDSQSIGRRYRRQDEIGTPYCVTVDFESIDDDKVTVRDRDTMRQDRIAVSELVVFLRKSLEE